MLRTGGDILDSRHFHVVATLRIGILRRTSLNGVCRPSLVLLLDLVDVIRIGVPRMRGKSYTEGVTKCLDL